MLVTEAATPGPQSGSGALLEPTAALVCAAWDANLDYAVLDRTVHSLRFASYVLLVKTLLAAIIRRCRGVRQAEKAARCTVE